MNTILDKLPLQFRLVLYTIVFVLFLQLSKYQGLYHSVFSFTLTGLVVWIWSSFKSVSGLSVNQHFLILSILSIISLTFSIHWNKTGIDLMWDIFILNHSIHPYLYTPVDPTIGKAQSALLFEFLSDPFSHSTTPLPLLVAFKPFYWFYKQVGLGYSILGLKLVLISMYASFIYYTASSRMNLFYIINPFIWLIGISQADPNVIGYILSTFGFYLYKSQQKVEALLLWGTTSLFGFEYVLLFTSVFLLIKTTKSDIVYFASSAFIWMIILWDTDAYKQFLFQSTDCLTTLQSHFRLLENSNIWVISLLYVFCIGITLILTITNRNQIKNWLQGQSSIQQFFSVQNIILLSILVVVLVTFRKPTTGLIWMLISVFSSIPYFKKQV